MCCVVERTARKKLGRAVAMVFLSIIILGLGRYRGWQLSDQWKRNYVFVTNENQEINWRPLPAAPIRHTISSHEFAFIMYVDACCGNGIEKNRPPDERLVREFELCKLVLFFFARLGMCFRLHFIQEGFRIVTN